MERRFRVGIMGATGRGDYGHRLDTAWGDVPDVQVVAVADADDVGREKTAKRLDCRQTYADYRQMMDVAKPDVVAVCPRWVDQHADVILAAAERGIHCFVEKPFCRDLREADAIINACEMSHTRIAIAHPTRYAPAMETVRRLLAEGVIGRVVELRGRGKEDRRGGGEDLWVLGSHIMDMVLTLGFDPQWCFASVLNDGHAVTKEDVYEGEEGIGLLAGDAVRAVYGVQQRETGESLTYSFQSYRNTGGKPSRYALWVCGSEGVIEIQEGIQPEIWILQSSSWNTARASREWQPVTSAGIGKPEPLDEAKFQRRHHVPIENLLQAIEEQQEPACGMYEGRRIVEMIAAVFESHRLGKPASFPLQTRDNPLELLTRDSAR